MLHTLIPSLRAALLSTLTATGLLAQGSWTPLTPLPQATEGMTVGVVGNTIIGAYGLIRGSGDSNLTRLYNISADSWSFGAPAPLPVRSEEAYGDTTHG